MPPAPASSLTRPRALALLALIVAIGAWLRFYGLAWGAPYYHFHIDEHSVMAPADLLRRDARQAALYPKFFMYSPLVMYLVNAVRWVYEAFGHPLDLTVPRDEVVYMVIGRGISAFFGTATIPLVYAIGARVAGRAAGLLSAAFLAFAVLHLRDSHFSTTDVSMTFFCVLALWWALRLADRGDWTSLIGGGIAFGLAILTKYAGAFVLGVLGLAYFLSPGRPPLRSPIMRWLVWAVRGVVPIAVGVFTFLAFDPLVRQYYGKFRSDIKDWVTDPLTGVIKPAWVSQFADVASPRLYWFTNLMWWGFGPALEIVGLIGIVWLAFRRDKRAAVVAAFPVVYFLAASGTIAPFIRYLIPLAPALALSSAVLCADGWRRPRWRWLSAGVTAVTLLSTAAYAFAYMNVFRQPDSRLVASQWLLDHVPADAAILVEPSHNTPPMGSYLTNVDFNREYVLFRNARRHDYYDITSLDTYNYLFDRRTPDDDRRTYIQAHLAAAAWIVMDDTFLQFYEHLPSPQYAVMKAYYRDLFAGRLGFELAQTFKVYPSLFGRQINDDGAELTFRLFDHPRVFIFKRTAAR